MSNEMNAICSPEIMACLVAAIAALAAIWQVLSTALNSGLQLYRLISPAITMPAPITQFPTFSIEVIVDTNEMC
jgi:hypothetical protein